MPASFEQLLVDHSYMCNALGDIMAVWHRRGDTGPLRMETLEPLAAKIGHSSSSLENLLSGTVRGSYTDNPVTFPDLPTIYTVARSQLEAYLTFYYLHIGPQSDEERELKYQIYVVGGLTPRQILKNDLITLQEEIQDERIAPLLLQIQQEANRIERLQELIQTNPLFNSMYSLKQRRAILSSVQPRARTQGWIDIIRASPLSSINFIGRWSLYSGHAHSDYISLLQMREYLPNHEEHDNHTRLGALKASLMVLSTFIGQFVAHLRLEKHYSSLHPDLLALIRFWQNFAQTA